MLRLTIEYIILKVITKLKKLKNVELSNIISYVKYNN